MGKLETRDRRLKMETGDEKLDVIKCDWRMDTCRALCAFVSKEREDDIKVLLTGDPEP